MKQIEVAAAVIIRKNTGGQNEIFCAQRGSKGEAAYKWEFPGGKLEQSETAEAAVIREIYEEFGAHIKADSFLMTVQHQYQAFHLTMHAYLCTLVSGSLERTEHVQSAWLTAEQMKTLDWAPADIPIVDRLMEISVSASGVS